MFEIKYCHHLLIRDYHFKLAKVQKVQSRRSATTAHATTEGVSLFGPPLEIVTDNVSR